MENPKVVSLNKHREQRRLERQESAAVIKDEIDGLFIDFFPTYHNTNLIWFDIENSDPDTISCQLLEDDFTPTEKGVVIDFANYINAHKPKDMIDYHLDSTSLNETPPLIVFKRQKSV